MGRYEVEKRRAIETEDYDLAKIKKIQMEEYRLQIYQQLEVSDLLKLSKVRISSFIKISLVFPF